MSSQRCGRASEVFTAHYLKDDPSKNSLNIEQEIRDVEWRNGQTSLFWLLLKMFGAASFGLMLLMQLLALFHELRNLNKPIPITKYQWPEAP